MMRHYGSEVSHLVKWCSDNNLSLNMEKKKEITIDSVPTLFH